MLISVRTSHLLGVDIFVRESRFTRSFLFDEHETTTPSLFSCFVWTYSPSSDSVDKTDVTDQQRGSVIMSGGGCGLITGSDSPETRSQCVFIVLSPTTG